MIWYVSYTGTPEKVIQNLQEHTRLFVTQENKEDYEKTLPHLISLVNKNHGKSDQLIIIAQRNVELSDKKIINASLSVTIKQWDVLI